jgi:hypothetical protein
VPDRRPLPLLILLILVVLTISAAVSGLLLAPASDDLTVQNAAGENLLAPSLSVRIVATQSAVVGGHVQSSPPIHQDFTFDPSKAPDPNTQSGVAALVVIDLLHHISQSSPWVTGPVSYRYTGPIGPLLGIPAEASNGTGLVVPLQSSGSAHAWVSGGYLGAFYVRFSITAGTVERRATELVLFRQIGDYTPHVAHVPA